MLASPTLTARLSPFSTPSSLANAAEMYAPLSHTSLVIGWGSSCIHALLLNAPPSSLGSRWKLTSYGPSSTTRLTIMSANTRHLLGRARLGLRGTPETRPSCSQRRQTLSESVDGSGVRAEPAA